VIPYSNCEQVDFSIVASLPYLNDGPSWSLTIINPLENSIKNDDDSVSYKQNKDTITYIFNTMPQQNLVADSIGFDVQAANLYRNYVLGLTKEENAVTIYENLCFINLWCDFDVENIDLTNIDVVIFFNSFDVDLGFVSKYNVKEIIIICDDDCYYTLRIKCNKKLLKRASSV